MGAYGKPVGYLTSERLHELGLDRTELPTTPARGRLAAAASVPSVRLDVDLRDDRPKSKGWPFG